MQEDRKGKERKGKERKGKAAITSVSRIWWGILNPCDHMQRLTKCLPKICLITLSPPETAG